jgi:hypothetical protein
VLRLLGLRTSFPTGSVVLLRGYELAHSTTEWTKESRFVGVHTTHEAVREHAYRSLGRPYPPSNLALNFETEVSKRRNVAAAESADEVSKSHGTNHRGADAIEGEAAGIPESLDPKIDQDKSARPDPAKNPFSNSDEEAGRSEYSSDTDISCRDFEPQVDYPDMAVEDKTDRDYMTVAFTEEITGPKYYELASPRKEKRSDTSSEDDDATSSED